MRQVTADRRCAGLFDKEAAGKAASLFRQPLRAA
jgi:hypothetical protein